MSVTPPGHPSAPSECARIARSWTRGYTRPGVHEAAAPWPIFALLCVSILHGLASESEKKASASGVQPQSRPADGVSRLVTIPACCQSIAFVRMYVKPGCQHHTL